MSTRHQPTKRRREHCRTTLSKTFQRRTLTRRNENQTQKPGCKREGRNSQTFKTDDHPVQRDSANFYRNRFKRDENVVTKLSYLRELVELKVQVVQLNMQTCTSKQYRVPTRKEEAVNTRKNEIINKP